MKKTGYEEVDPDLLIPKGDKFHSLCLKVGKDLKDMSNNPELTPNSGLYRAYFSVQAASSPNPSYIEVVVASDSREGAYRNAVVFLKRHKIHMHVPMNRFLELNRSSQWNMSRRPKGSGRELIKKPGKKVWRPVSHRVGPTENTVRGFW